MNRLITDKGSLSGTAGAGATTILRGNTYAGSAAAQGQDYVYDAAGQRVAALRTEYTPNYGDRCVIPEIATLSYIPAICHRHIAPAL